MRDLPVEQASPTRPSWMAESPAASLQPHRPRFRREDDRGEFVEVLTAGPWETVITGTMRAGAVLGNHYHKRTRMYFHLLSGSAHVEIVQVNGGRRRNGLFVAGDGCYLEPNEAHAIRFAQPSAFLLLKSHSYRADDSDTFAFNVCPPIKEP